jgi:cytoskeletal protein CcmA (bactofilin family)
LTIGLDEGRIQDQSSVLALLNATDPVTIRRSITIKGEVIGSESLVIEGNVEGMIRVPDCRVTVGQDAEVYADIAAREVIVFGRVLGNIDASDRVDLRSEASYWRCDYQANPDYGGRSFPWRPQHYCAGAIG